jgi:hypothetical protein
LRSGLGWASIAIADQLSYDTALVGLASSLRIPCDLDNFESPEVERNRLEAALMSRGFDLDTFGIDQPFQTP